MALIMKSALPGVMIARGFDFKALHSSYRVPADRNAVFQQYWNYLFDLPESFSTWILEGEGQELFEPKD